MFVGLYLNGKTEDSVCLAKGTGSWWIYNVVELEQKSTCFNEHQIWKTSKLKPQNPCQIKIRTDVSAWPKARNLDSVVNCENGIVSGFLRRRLTNVLKYVGDGEVATSRTFGNRRGRDLEGNDERRYLAEQRSVHYNWIANHFLG